MSGDVHTCYTAKLKHVKNMESTNSAQLEKTYKSNKGVYIPIHRDYTPLEMRVSLLSLVKVTGSTKRHLLYNKLV